MRSPRPPMSLCLDFRKSVHRYWEGPLDKIEKSPLALGHLSSATEGVRKVYHTCEHV